MELRNISGACILLPFFFYHIVSAVDPTSAAGALPICAQVCLASAFSICACTLLDFKCGCTCSKFTPDAKSCIQNSCSLEFQNSAIGMISSTCETATSTTTQPSSTKITSASSTSSIITTTSSNPGSLTTATSEPGGIFGMTSTITPAGGIGGTVPTSKVWGPYGGNTIEYGNATQCWTVTASGTARSTCALGANIFNSGGTDSKPDSMVAFFLWSLGVFLLLDRFD